MGVGGVFGALEGGGDVWCRKRLEGYGCCRVFTVEGCVGCWRVCMGVLGCVGFGGCVWVLGCVVKVGGCRVLEVHMGIGGWR